VALQFLGNLFEYFLSRRSSDSSASADSATITVLGATSGDTGSAAIEGLRGKKGVEVYILHPAGRVAPVQEAQMTTVLDENVHNISVDGTFDDCQSMVKALFNDEVFRSKHRLAAVNSINWARIMAQIVYYFYAYFRWQVRCVPLPTAHAPPCATLNCAVTAANAPHYIHRFSSFVRKRTQVYSTSITTAIRSFC
jgi:threonine synthase